MPTTQNTVNQSKTMKTQNSSHINLCEESKIEQ